MRAYCVGNTVFIEVDNLNDLKEMNIVIKKEDPTALEPMEMEPEVVNASRKKVLNKAVQEYRRNGSDR